MISEFANIKWRSRFMSSDLPETRETKPRRACAQYQLWHHTKSTNTTRTTCISPTYLPHVDSKKNLAPLRSAMPLSHKEMKLTHLDGYHLHSHKKRLTTPVDKQFKILGLALINLTSHKKFVRFHNIKQLRGGSLQNIFKTFRIKLRLMVWFTIIERASRSETPNNNKKSRSMPPFSECWL